MEALGHVCHRPVSGAFGDFPAHPPGIGRSRGLDQISEVGIGRFAQAARDVIVSAKGGIQCRQPRKGMDDEELGILTRRQQGGAPDSIIA